MIEILDKRLKKVDILRKYTFAQYSMKFRDIGTFTIDARITEENLFLLNEEEEYSILFDGNIFGKVLKITRESDSENEKVIKIQGLLSSRFLDQRVLRFESFDNKTYKNIYDLMTRYRNNYEETGWLDIEVKYEDEQRLERVCTKSKKQQTGVTYWECIKDFLDQDYLGIYFNPIVKPEHEHQLGIYDPFMTNISKWELIISAGVDRTKRNTDGNIPVIFSQSLSNIKDTSLELNRESYKNIAYVAGEGEGEGRTWIQVRTKNITTDEQIFPWSVNEMYVDARDIQATKQDGTQMSDEEYTKLLEERAEEKFSENNKTKIYSATIIQANKQYTYLKDYKLGDWITIQDKELGIEVDAQITEITKSITGMSEIIDLEVTYGQIRKEPVEQIKTLVNKTNKQNNDIKYIENKTKSTKDYIIESGKVQIGATDRYNCYEKYASGKLVQWGIANCSYTDGYGIIKYAIPFAGSTKDYVLFAQGQYISGKVVEIMVASKNTTSQGVAYSRGLNGANIDTHDFDWYAIGKWK